MEYFCCGLHHSSYCPACRGEFCKDMVVYGLHPQGGNDDKIAKVIKEMREKND